MMSRKSGSCNFSFLKNPLVQINSKLNSKPYDYLYKLHSTQCNYHYERNGIFSSKLCRQNLDRITDWTTDRIADRITVRITEEKKF